MILGVFEMLVDLDELLDLGLTTVELHELVLDSGGGLALPNLESLLKLFWFFALEVQLLCFFIEIKLQFFKLTLSLFETVLRALKLIFEVGDGFELVVAHVLLLFPEPVLENFNLESMILQYELVMCELRFDSEFFLVKSARSLFAKSNLVLGVL